MSDEEIRKTNESSDIFNEMPEFIASVPSIASGFALTDSNSPRYKSFSAIRKRFGEFLHQASVALLGQGDENTVDAVQMLIRSCRTYLFEYGDSRDDHSSQRDRYVEEISLSRQYAKQKMWPRAIFVRRARLYHAARLHWNSLERYKGPLEDAIIDDMMEWSMWHYATVRAQSQSLLESMTFRYDGVRRRCYPRLYSNLVKGTEDDRMKGALYTLNSSAFAKCAMGEPTLVKDFIKTMFNCQWNEKPSIQDCVSTMTENCMSSLVEPNYIVFSVDHPPTAISVATLQELVPRSLADPKLVSKCEANRKKRIQSYNDAVAETIRNVLEVANDPATHWRYEIAAIRILRTLIRRDQCIGAPQLQYFLEQTAADHPSMRYYAQRAVMKATRYLKLRAHNNGIKDLALSRHPTKVACFTRVVTEEMGWRFAAWAPELTTRYWAEIGSEHDEVRAYIADALVVFQKIHWRPRPSVPVAEVFVRECRTRPTSDDIMGIDSGWHMKQFMQLVDRLPKMRETRLTGARAPRSPYDRTLTTIIKWLSQSLYDINASSVFQYLLPLLPELFKAAELQDSDELAGRSQMLLVTMCGVTPPLSLVPRLLETIFETVRHSTSWRIRLNTLPILQVCYFRNVPLIEDEMVIRIQDVLSERLNDEVVEVREMAATTLSGILRCSPRRSILILKERFARRASNITLPKRNAPSYPTKLRQLHAAILGVTALIDAFPYSVPHWLPELIGDVLSRHAYDPIPISSSVRKCATKFKETHSDTWHEDSLKFDEEQMSALTTLLAGSSYYA
ncbi:hypothetical protein FRC02_008249 [Tulasnella sp. 418]|nr:hypothetical protein FRC02_008249 [Tulasnella sp. 418]